MKCKLSIGSHLIVQDNIFSGGYRIDRTKGLAFLMPHSKLLQFHIRNQTPIVTFLTRMMKHRD